MTVGVTGGFYVAFLRREELKNDGYIERKRKSFTIEVFFMIIGIMINRIKG